MEGANRGPYARLLPLSNGHYRRVVDPVVPKIFMGCDAWCNDNADTLNFEFINEETYAKNCTKYNCKTGKEHTEKLVKHHSNVSGRNSSAQLSIVHQSELSRTSTNTTNYEYSEQEDNTLTNTNLNKVEPEKEIIMVRSGTTRQVEQTKPDEGTFGINLNKIYEEDGLPVLFYTKNREKPTLMMLIIDQEMEVIYMKRNKVSRFFPIKLIDKIVTSPQRIQEEFSKQIKKDSNIRLNNMVLFHASNFTDSVAIQFADEVTKEHFVNEVNYIKDLIKRKF